MFNCWAARKPPPNPIATAMIIAIIKKSFEELAIKKSPPVMRVIPSDGFYAG
jgi:hypothetical protein